ncbi:MAG: sodium-dependent transporter [Bacteroides sp.]|nr:sodium-dependent transporter [Bacteroides sp.]MCM1412805.1 sodium-dependent transporter [Bacteroides sp.]MCM1470901.1 sodium-dependent transporter [Bacteroides sp.]
MAKKSLFKSKVGMIAATVGSAVGLGNVWRFPAEVHDGGGAAFLMIYILCVVLLGIPVMLSEFAVGRAGRSDASGAIINCGASRRWGAIGVWATVASYLILCFYMVVSGWTLEYLFESISGGLFDSVGNSNASANALFTEKMEQFITDGFNPLVCTYLMIVINIGVLIAGVTKGIERLSNIAMPLLFVILLIFVVVCLSLPNAFSGVEYFLKPDFSKLSSKVVINALGQAFFSLSLGMGILITYAGYFPDDTKLVKTATTISLLDLLVAFMMGLIIFPAITSFGLTGESIRGATLVFVSLPEVFSLMPCSQLWAILFFLLLTIAALTSTISIAEVSVAFITDRFGVKRWKSVLIVLIPLFVFSTLCSLSMGPMSGFKIMGYNLFDFLDNLATNIMLPVGSIFLCVYVGWVAPKRMFANQLSNDGRLHNPVYPMVVNVVRFVAPVLIAIVLISSLI